MSAMIVRAAELARHLHHGQLQADGRSYFDGHVMAVADPASADRSLARTGAAPNQPRRRASRRAAVTAPRSGALVARRSVPKAIVRNPITRYLLAPHTTGPLLGCLGRADPRHTTAPRTTHRELLDSKARTAPAIRVTTRNRS